MDKIKLDKYVTMPSSMLPTNKLVKYWEMLLECDLIGDRFPEVDKCGKTPEKEYMSIITDIAPMMHYVVDTDTLEVIAEFTISDIFGKVGLIHFSFSPLETPQTALMVCRTTTDRIIREWRNSENPEEPYVRALAGLTPIKNHRACRFIKRVGFKPKTVIPFGAIYDNQECDALVTVKTL